MLAQIKKIQRLHNQTFLDLLAKTIYTQYSSVARVRSPGHALAAVYNI